MREIEAENSEELKETVRFIESIEAPTVKSKAIKTTAKFYLKPVSILIT
jgi:hypothetical protein